jgi:hypothetical protein
MLIIHDLTSRQATCRDRPDHCISSVGMWQVLVTHPFCRSALFEGPSLPCLGWIPTLKLINRWHGSLENFLNLHQVDILCLQEVLISSLTPRSLFCQQTHQFDSDLTVLSKPHVCQVKIQRQKLEQDPQLCGAFVEGRSG